MKVKQEDSNPHGNCKSKLGDEMHRQNQFICIPFYRTLNRSASVTVSLSLSLMHIAWWINVVMQHLKPTLKGTARGSEPLPPRRTVLSTKIYHRGVIALSCHNLMISEALNLEKEVTGQASVPQIILRRTKQLEREPSPWGMGSQWEITLMMSCLSPLRVLG